ncbi:C3a anaphylatoxin chemotactic receptor [Trichomycterus rosablanca]|uniref:C3a anaphylatoxin chemotactic receptor n=1 Tax=Trichomycterus rosablanca TaxID=2290929 RepID=UPI002F353F71
MATGEALRVLQMVVTVLIFSVGVTLNGLVVWVLGVRRRRGGRSVGGETQSAGSFRFYVVNLALADLVLLLRTPLMLGYLAHHYSWPFGKPLCQVVMFLRCLGLYAGAFLLSAIALERCLCLLRPVWARLRRPRWAVPLICAVLWGLAGALSVPYITAAGLVRIHNTSQCLENITGIGSGLVALETGVGFLLPLVIFLSCNLAVIVFARKSESAQTTPGSPASPGGPSYTSQRLNRLYRILFLTMLLFLTCWVPYFTCRFLKALASGREDRAGLYAGASQGIYVSLFLVYVKSALNPVLYVFAARGLSRTVRASLLSAVEKVFNEDISDSLRRKSLRRRDSQL